jgi:hypothetical protein
MGRGRERGRCPLATIGAMSRSRGDTSKTRRARAKALPWALLLQAGVVIGRRWRALSAKDRARLSRLAQRSRGRPGNLSAKERRQLRKLIRKLDLGGAGRELASLARRGRRRRRRCKNR